MAHTPPTSLTLPTHRSALSGMLRLHLLLGIQSLIVILLSINRLSSLTAGYVSPNEFLRWVDINNMLILPLASLIAFYFVKKWLEAVKPEAADNWRVLLNVIFIAGVYLLGVGYGDHEITNYLHTRFCLDSPDSPICRIIIFNDDEFSHWVFFAGFVMTNGALMFLQAAFNPQIRLLRRDLALLIGNGVFIAAGIFANLAFETIGLDLYIVAALAACSVYLLWRKGPRPLLVYYATAYCLGLVSTGLYNTVSG